MGEYTVGGKIKLTLKSNTQIEGVVFAVDLDRKRLVLEENPNSALRNTRFINLAAVVKTEQIDTAEPIKVEPLFPLTRELAAKREKQACILCEKSLLDSSRRPPKDVTPQGRKVFDALSKTYECKWNGLQIEETKLGVTISPPYTPNEVSGKDLRAVSRVKDVLASIILRMQGGPK